MKYDFIADTREVRNMFYSPLRYPGGKGKLATFMEYMRNRNGIRLIGDNTETIKFSKSELENIEAVLDLYYRLIND